MPLTKDMYWAIGIFEGEGSIVFNRYGRSKFGQVVLTIQITDKDVVKRFYKIVKVGNFRGPYNNYHNGKKCKQTWVWSCGVSAEVTKLLELWLPLLSKRRKVKAVMAIKRTKASIAYMKQRNMCCKNGHSWTKYAVTAKNGTRRCKACLDVWHTNRNKLRKE